MISKSIYLAYGIYLAHTSHNDDVFCRCNEHQCPDTNGVCNCCDYCASSPCSAGSTCQNNCISGHLYGYDCLCPDGTTGRLCEITIAKPTSAPQTDKKNDQTWLIILLVCLAVGKYMCLSCV